jgi:hypothetical protein
MPPSKDCGFCLPARTIKAVDVVETRVNALGPSVLLRLGRGRDQTNLSQYLTTLLANRATAEDDESFRETQHEYSLLTAEIRDATTFSQTVQGQKAPPPCVGEFSPRPSPRSRRRGRFIFLDANPGRRLLVEPAFVRLQQLACVLAAVAVVLANRAGAASGAS